MILLKSKPLREWKSLQILERGFLTPSPILDLYSHCKFLSPSIVVPEEVGQSRGKVSRPYPCFSLEVDRQLTPLHHSSKAET